jgi:UDP-N-acetylmuramyl pentapeptide phosphotransferase/UDP-N-acetylglucosamine-1-phosphate transferase
MDLSIAVAVALLVSLVACRALMASGPLDAPNQVRKSHRAPTPTIGGIGVAFGLAISLVALSMFPDAWRLQLTAQGARLLVLAIGFAYAFLFVGFVDDAWPLGPRLKILVFTAISLGAAWSASAVSTLPFGGGRVLVLPYGLALAGSALWVFVLVNCVNFLDGLNGLAMGTMAIGLLALGAISLMLESPSGAGLSFCAVGALCGLLVWNFPGGRLFAGDSGALFVGGIGALASLLVIHRTGLSPFVPPILFLPVLADPLLTLLWRTARGARLLEGHTEHVYQLLFRSGWTHVRVSLTYWAATAVCGIVAIAFAAVQNGAYAWAGLVVLTTAAIAISAFVRRAVVLPA